MKSNLWRVVSLPVVLVALGAPFLTDCAALKKIPGMPTIPGNCPDTASVEAIASVDFAKEFGFDVDASAKVKGAMTAGVQIQALAASIEADLKLACGKLATDLGAEPGDSAESACKAAAKAIGDMKVKAGGSFKLSFTAPKCSASMSAMADCAASCDASVKGPSAEVKCEGGEISGTCGAKCSGSCSMEAGAKCEGSCGGTCEGDMSGTCEGKCNGKCDGKKSTAECKGKCEGKCEGNVKGECKGTCKGGCELKAGGECKGECTGSCSAKMEAPKCSGEVKPPEMSADCKGKCDAQVSAKLECTPAKVTLVATGAGDAKAAAKLVAAIEANLPAVLKVAIGMKEKVVKVAGNVKGVVEGVAGGLTGMVKGGPTMALQVTACLVSPFKGYIDAAASIQANVDVSVSVNASASASGGTK